MKKRLILSAAGFAVVCTSAALASRNEAIASAITHGSVRMHVRLVRTTPADSEIVTASPRAVTLWFSAAPELAVTTIKLATASGAAIATEAPKRGDASMGAGGDAAVVTPIKEILRPGKYTVTWKTAAQDGHPASGTFVFTVAQHR